MRPNSPVQQIQLLDNVSNRYRTYNGCSNVLSKDCQQNYDLVWTLILARSRLLLRCPPENTVRHLVEDSSAKVSEETSTNINIIHT